MCPNKFVPQRDTVDTQPFLLLFGWLISRIVNSILIIPSLIEPIEFTAAYSTFEVNWTLRKRF